MRDVLVAYALLRDGFAATRARSVALTARALIAGARSRDIQTTTRLLLARLRPGGTLNALTAAFADLEAAARATDAACAAARDADEFERAFLDTVAEAARRLDERDRAALYAGLGGLAAALHLPASAPLAPRPVRFRPRLRR